ncbi:hypothetical protein M9H77_19688 [Catharanthus roseus]|uniref:Uncharacterized protein n=1 Tax=Catharanthus roseus TaxID=4058 RepID=A0ACC0BB35_CATRO|nr:hypothetical protein M9H77_19688 [Catharanthus roseus]
MSSRTHGRTVTTSSSGLRSRHSLFDIPTTPARVGPFGLGYLIQPPPIPSRVRTPHDFHTPLPYHSSAQPLPHRSPSSSHYLYELDTSNHPSYYHPRTSAMYC